MSKSTKLSIGVAQTRVLIQSWITEAERKLEKAEKAGAATAGAYLKGRLDGYRDCLAAMSQQEAMS